MKKALFISLAILIGTFAANGQCIPTKSGELPYSTGENLSYVLSYKWNAVNTDVATASLKLDTVRLNGKLVYHSKMTARTKAFYESGKWSAREREALYRKARRQMLRHSLTPQNLQTARENGEMQFQQMFKAMGYKTVVVKSEE